MSINPLTQRVLDALPLYRMTQEQRQELLKAKAHELATLFSPIDNLVIESFVYECADEDNDYDTGVIATVYEIPDEVYSPQEFDASKAEVFESFKCRFDEYKQLMITVMANSGII